MNALSQTPGRHRTVFVLCFAAAFICYIDRVNISVAAIAMQEQFGWNESVKGLVLSSFFVGYLMTQVLSGWLANRLGGELILAGAVLWWSLWTILTPSAAVTSLFALVLVRIAMGLGEAAMFPAALNIVGRLAVPAERSRAIGLIMSGIPAGTLFALVTTGWLITRFRWPSVFYVFGIAGVIWAVIWCYRTIWNGKRPRAGVAGGGTGVGPAGAAHGTIPWRRLLTQPGIWGVVVGHFCTNWILYVFMAWLPSYLHTVHGLAIGKAGLFAAAPWIAMFVMTNVAAWSADRLLAQGMAARTIRNLMQTIGLLGPAVSLLAVRETHSMVQATVGLCFAAGTLGFTNIGYLPRILEIEPAFGGIVLGISNTFATIPGIVAVWTTGKLVDATGSYDAPFALIMVVAVVGVAAFTQLGRSSRHETLSLPRAP